MIFDRGRDSEEADEDQYWSFITTQTAIAAIRIKAQFIVYTDRKSNLDKHTAIFVIKLGEYYMGCTPRRRAHNQRWSP